MNKKEIEFEFERAMKNTYRFHEKRSGNSDQSINFCGFRNIPKLSEGGIE